jgi:hypothetical protein
MLGKSRGIHEWRVLHALPERDAEMGQAWQIAGQP